jgi:hypothetical protein
MDERQPRGTTSTARLASAGSRPNVLVAAAVLFVAIAVVKPWQGGPGLADATEPPRATTAVGAPSPSPRDPLSDIRRHCAEPLGWRVYSRERWSSGTIRSWRTMSPVESADGPLDPGIPVTPSGAVLEALGYCSPWRADERPPAEATVAAWRIRAGPGGRPGAIEIRLEPIAPRLDTPLGALFAPPAGVGGSGARAGLWQPGRYVFAVRGDAYSRWWAIELDPRDVAALDEALE